MPSERIRQDFYYSLLIKLVRRTSAGRCTGERVGGAWKTLADANDLAPWSRLNVATPALLLPIYSAIFQATERRYEDLEVLRASDEARDYRRMPTVPCQLPPRSFSIEC